MEDRLVVGSETEDQEDDAREEGVYVVALAEEAADLKL
jgi:hypothetical protein